MTLQEVTSYVEANSKGGKCELPYVMYVILVEYTQARSRMFRPQPPKYNIGGGISGFFSHKRDSYVYDFNDPIYLVELKKYEAISQQQQIGISIHLYTSIGQVEIIPVSGVTSDET
jgi:hypothetical protein